MIPVTANSESNWEPCPEGKLGDFARELSEGRRRRFVTRSAVGLCWIVFLAVGIRQLLPAAELTCTETKSHIGAYFDASLDTATRKQVKQHLSDCPHCKSFYASRSANSQATRQPNV